MDLEKMTVAEIKAQAKEMGIKNVSALKKGELIEAVRQAQGNAPANGDEKKVTASTGSARNTQSAKDSVNSEGSASHDKATGSKKTTRNGKNADGDEATGSEKHTRNDKNADGDEATGSEKHTRNDKTAGRDEATGSDKSTSAEKNTGNDKNEESQKSTKNVKSDKSGKLSAEGGETVRNVDTPAEKERLENRADVVKEIETLEKIAAQYYEKKKEESSLGTKDADKANEAAEAYDSNGKGQNKAVDDNRQTNYKSRDSKANEFRPNNRASEGSKPTDNRASDGSRTTDNRASEGSRPIDNRVTDGNRYGDNRGTDGSRYNENRQNDTRQNNFRQNDNRQRDNRQNDFRQNQQRQEDGRQSQQRYDDNRQNQRQDDSRQSQQRYDDNRQNQRQDDSRQSQQRYDDNRQNQQRQEESRQPQQEQGAERRGGMYVYPDESYDLKNIMTPEMAQMDSNETKTGILEVCPEGYGFIRSANFLPGDDDVYVSPAQIRRLNLKTGDFITGNTRIKTSQEKFSALLYVKSVNGRHPSEAVKRPRFEDLTPIFPHERIHLETPGCTPAMRIVDILSPIGKGQRGMIVSQPKAGKTTLLKQIASAIIKNNPEMHVMILLIDERPEEVTDMKESINGDNVEVIYSTFDELPENHKRVSEMVIGRAKRLVEHKKDVVILLDSITRLARAYNLTCTSSGRTLSGGLDPAALHMPKKFFGAARCMREGGSLTILATALVETGSRMDDVVFEEFKGTGNMELVLDRNLSERRIFPAIDLPRSSTRRDDLLLNSEELETNEILRHAFNSSKNGEAVEKIINMFAHTRNNAEFIQIVKKTRFV